MHYKLNRSHTFNPRTHQNIVAVQRITDYLQGGKIASEEELRGVLHGVQNPHGCIVKWLARRSRRVIIPATVTESGNMVRPSNIQRTVDTSNTVSLMWMRRLIPRPCNERPFVCEGLPSDSMVIVIGENPATPMEKDWWSYWDNNHGMNFELFDLDYKAQRASIGKSISNTRRRLDRFRRNGVKCVETNAFSNERLDGAGMGISNYAVLESLIASMPLLSAVVAHGKIAQDFVEGTTLPANVKLYKTRHFRLESYDTIDRICAEQLVETKHD